MPELSDAELAEIEALYPYDPRDHTGINWDAPTRHVHTLIAVLRAERERGDALKCAASDLLTAIKDRISSGSRCILCEETPHNEDCEIEELQAALTAIAMEGRKGESQRRPSAVDTTPESARAINGDGSPSATPCRVCGLTYFEGEHSDRAECIGEPYHNYESEYRGGRQ